MALHRPLWLAAGLAALGVLFLAIAATGMGGGRAAEAEQLVPGARGAVPLRPAMRRAQSLLYDDDFYPYWERENTGDPESFASAYVDLCIRRLGPCPGPWDSRDFSGDIRDTYEEGHPEIGL